MEHKLIYIIAVILIVIAIVILYLYTRVRNVENLTISNTVYTYSNYKTDFTKDASTNLLIGEFTVPTNYKSTSYLIIDYKYAPSKTISINSIVGSIYDEVTKSDVLYTDIPGPAYISTKTTDTTARIWSLVTQPQLVAGRKYKFHMIMDVCNFSNLGAAITLKYYT